MLEETHLLAVGQPPARSPLIIGALLALVLLSSLVSLVGLFLVNLYLYFISLGLHWVAVFLLATLSNGFRFPDLYIVLDQYRASKPIALVLAILFTGGPIVLVFLGLLPGVGDIYSYCIGIFLILLSYAVYLSLYGITDRFQPPVPDSGTVL